MGELSSNAWESLQYKDVSYRGIFQEQGEKEAVMERVEDLFVGICLSCALERQRPKY